MPTYITPAEIADMLKVDITTVQRWIRTKQLPAVRAGRQYRVDIQTLAEFLAGKEQPPTTTKNSGLAYAG